MQRFIEAPPVVACDRRCGLRRVTAPMTRRPTIDQLVAANKRLRRRGNRLTSAFRAGDESLIKLTQMLSRRPLPGAAGRLIHRLSTETVDNLRRSRGAKVVE
jgi:hypothetical protein